MNEQPFVPSWPEPNWQLLQPETPPAPPLPLAESLSSRLAQWVEQAAQSKGAPADYVFASLMSVFASALGNSRWVRIWHGWSEPPILWSMCIGLPSAGKSPAVDAAVLPLRNVERELREAEAAKVQAWDIKNDVAKIAEQGWKEAVKAALKNGDTSPEKPKECAIDPAPHMPRLVVNDATIERLGALLARQQRGTLQLRDELAGWLEGMTRYASGGSDRAFWLEAFGGRSHTVERMSRDPITVEQLSVSVLGGIQPDRLSSLLLKSDDDGLVARFLPVWPEPAPIRRPLPWHDEALIERAQRQVLSVQPVLDKDGREVPHFVPLSAEAQNQMDALRVYVRMLEAGSEGLMISFVGKLPGMAARLALVLTFLEWSIIGGAHPTEVTGETFGKAKHLLLSYYVPMAQRAYSSGSMPKGEKAARALLSVIGEKKLTSFSTHDVYRFGRRGKKTKADLDPALAILEEAGWIQSIEMVPGPKGGRKRREFAVNPALYAQRSAKMG